MCSLEPHRYNASYYLAPSCFPTFILIGKNVPLFAFCPTYSLNIYCSAVAIYGVQPCPYIDPPPTHTFLVTEL